MTPQVNSAAELVRAVWPVVAEPTTVREVTERTRVWRHRSATAATAVALPAPALAQAAAGSIASDAMADGAAANAPEPESDLAQSPATAAPEAAMSPAIASDVFQLARRMALQADLAATMRVLVQGVSRLTGSRDALCVFDPGLASAWAMPGPEALDDELRALAAEVASTGQRAVTPHALAESVGLPPVRAVLIARRAADGALYDAAAAATLAAIANAVAGLVGHFAAEHQVRREQAARDAKSPFRSEALSARRGAVATPGRPVAPPRTWMRWAYPALIGLVATLIAAAAMIEVPTYSTGAAVVTVDGAQVTSSTPGTVAELLVAPGTRVATGDPVLRLHAGEEETDLAATETDYRNALSTFLTSPGDSGARGALAAITTRRQRARAVVDARTLRAPAAGIVGDIRVHPGQLVAAGAPVMKIAPTADLAVIAVLPGIDRPRLAAGMTLQIEFSGYRKRREQAVIDAIGGQVIGPDEARRSLGGQIGDALPISGPVVLVRGHLAARTFEAGGREYEFYDGMIGKAEVRVDSDRLLRLLLPGKHK